MANMTLKWLIVVIATAALFDRGSCLTCLCYDDPNISAQEWRAQNCPVDYQCPSGRQLIWDICHCCLSSCTMLEGESCGGEWDMEGVCGEGLECYTSERDYYGKCVTINATSAATNAPASESTTVPLNVAGGTVTTDPMEKMQCGKNKMALMGEEEREKCEEVRRIRIQARRERNGKRNTTPRL